MQYSELANEVRNGRGKVPVADYQVAEYVNSTDMGMLLNVEPVTRSCYSFCMCPGGQVLLISVSHPLLYLFFTEYKNTMLCIIMRNPTSVVPNNTTSIQCSYDMDWVFSLDIRDWIILT